MLDLLWILVHFERANDHRLRLDFSKWPGAADLELSDRTDATMVHQDLEPRSSELFPGGGTLIKASISPTAGMKSGMKHFTSSQLDVK